MTICIRNCGDTVVTSDRVGTLKHNSHGPVVKQQKKKKKKKHNATTGIQSIISEKKAVSIDGHRCHNIPKRSLLLRLNSQLNQLSSEHTKWPTQAIIYPLTQVD